MQIPENKGTNDSFNSREFHKIPVGPLGIMAMDGSRELCSLINDYIVGWRKDFASNNSEPLLFPGYSRESYLISANCYRFATGEGKAVVNETVRGYDIYIVADVGNYNCRYKMFGMDCPMSPDDHYQDLKRLIAAIGGKARRVSVIMPMLYEGRQHRRISRESLDCALALQELTALGVENIITFDAHDPRVQNSIPLKGFENLRPSYQFIKAMLNNEKGLEIKRDKMLVISPDEGGIERCLYYSNILGLDLGLFYKRRDYTKIVGGRNPIISHEFLGESIDGKDVLIVDDLLSSGESILDICYELKKRKANRIYVAVTFSLFTDGLEEYDKAFKDDIFTKIFSTNLTFRRPELLVSQWYVDVDISKFIAYLIDTLNHDQSISSLMDPSEKIRRILLENQS
ncbi:MAG: ribose-phosphate pyrophosphokinase [Ignavibacteria bacterium]|nr:ribose-phosphate pyrophosphokinase [Ignavibacteria bacterium]